MLIAVRDPMGFRPLALGKAKDTWIASSETCAFDLIDADLVREEEARIVAEIVRRLIGNYQIWDKRSQTMRVCRAGDIALLAPTGASLWRYERALESHRVPVASQAGKGFFRRQEIQDLIALSRAIADRRDTLGFGALLRGPLVGLTEEEIAVKFTALGGDVIGKGQCEKLRECVMNIDSADRVDELLTLTIASEL